MELKQVTATRFLYGCLDLFIRITWITWGRILSDKLTKLFITQYASPSDFQVMIYKRFKQETAKFKVIHQ